MQAYLTEWLALLIRWIHVIAGVAWIGASFYFIWLDNHLREPPQWKKEKGIKGDLWAIHGGGFYEIAKYRYAPERMPEELHWFKWEAYTTLLSGMSLLFVVYYLGSPGYLVDPAKADLSTGTAMALGLGGIALVLAIYEALIRSPLAAHGKLFGLILFAVLTLADWAYFQWFSGRGAFIHVGATIGTIMVANVFLGIIPSQKALVATVSAGREPDARIRYLADLAKLRSTHNNYLTLPIIFIMISNHYPSLYGHPHGWAILAAIGFITAFARHYFNLRHRGIHKPSILVSSALMGLILVWILAPAPTPEPRISSAAPVADTRIQAIMQTRCLSCHASKPTQPGFNAAPAGIILEEPAQWIAHRDRIMQAAVSTRYMPLGNITGMTEEERGELGQWLRQKH